eukprot:gene9258-biopygen169
MVKSVGFHPANKQASKQASTSNSDEQASRQAVQAAGDDVALPGSASDPSKTTSLGKRKLGCAPVALYPNSENRIINVQQTQPMLGIWAPLQCSCPGATVRVVLLPGFHSGGGGYPQGYPCEYLPPQWKQHYPNHRSRATKLQGPCVYLPPSKMHHNVNAGACFFRNYVIFKETRWE